MTKLNKIYELVGRHILKNARIPDMLIKGLKHCNHTFKDQDNIVHYKGDITNENEAIVAPSKAHKSRRVRTYKEAMAVYGKFINKCTDNINQYSNALTNPNYYKNTILNIRIKNANKRNRSIKQATMKRKRTMEAKRYKIEKYNKFSNVINNPTAMKQAEKIIRVNRNNDNNLDNNNNNFQQ